AWHPWQDSNLLSRVRSPRSRPRAGAGEAGGGDGGNRTLIAAVRERSLPVGRRPHWNHCGGPDGDRTRLDPARQAGGITRCPRGQWGDHRESNPDLEVHSLPCIDRYTMATMNESARGESNAGPPLIERLHFRCATGRRSGWQESNLRLPRSKRGRL